MSLTPSSMIPLGYKAPSFNLLDPKTGTKKSLEELKGKKATLIMFICNHCPFVVHIEKALIQLGLDYDLNEVSIIAINSNDADVYVEDGPEFMVQKAYHFPYLYDESQDVAKAYQAMCTPDFFLFDQALACIYRGQFDDARPGNGKLVTGKNIKEAIDSVLHEQAINAKQLPSIGCNIKWK